jgi:CheY-like chemotaxis protein
VLVVDDNDDFRSSTSDILRTVGYTVFEAADGEDALSLLTTMRFDAMVLDLKMPRRDGASLLSALSEPPTVVVVSAFELDDETRHRAGSTIVAHLSKPVPPQQLLDAVADAVIGEERS